MSQVFGVKLIARARHNKWLKRFQFIVSMPLAYAAFSCDVWAQSSQTVPYTGNTLPSAQHIELPAAADGADGRSAVRIQTDGATPTDNATMQNWRVKGADGGVGSGWTSGGQGGRGVEFKTGTNTNHLTISAGTQVRAGHGGESISGSYNSSGAGGEGIYFSGQGNLINHGEILGGDGGRSSTYGSGKGGEGIYYYGTGNLTNTGIVRAGTAGSTTSRGNGGDGIYGVEFHGDGNVDNSGEIYGGNGGNTDYGNFAGFGSAGLYFRGNGNITNSGTIQGGHGGQAFNANTEQGYGGAGVFIRSSSSGHFFNTASGVIRGGNGGDATGVAGAYANWGGDGVTYDTGVSAGGNFTNEGLIAAGHGSQYADRLHIGGSGSQWGHGGTGVTYTCGANCLAAGYGVMTNGVNAMIIGGNGNSGLDTASNGGGGVVFSGVSLSNYGKILGGHGGNIATDPAGHGYGGVALDFKAGQTLVNTGTIEGGNGGLAPVNSADFPRGNGVYLRTSNTLVLNSGTIAGGMRDDGTRAESVYLVGNSNTIELRAGATIRGNIYAQGNAQKFVLGGDTTAPGGNVFDIGLLTEKNAGNWASFTKNGLSTWTLTGTANVTSNWDIEQGRLDVGAVAGDDARMTGNVLVHNGATLGGHGSVAGTVTLRNGATLAPGSAIGTLTVGDIVFQSGSTYQYEEHPDGSADKVVVTRNLGGGATGTATIDSGAVLNILSSPGNWAANTKHVIIDADGGIIYTGSGTGFSTVNSSLAFLDYALDYSNPNQIVLALKRNDTSLGEVTLSPRVGNTYNQRHTGWGIESLGSAHPVYKQIIGMSAVQALHAYDNLSGEIHASIKSALLENSRYRMNAVLQHLDALNSHTARVEGALQGEQPDAGKGLWVQTWYHDGHLKNDGNAAKLDNKGFGILAGADIFQREHVVLGAALGFERNETSADAWRDSTADADAVHLMAYGQADLGPVDLKGGIGYSWLDVESTRHLRVGTLTSKNTGDYDGGIFQIFVQGGHTFELSPQWSLTPYAGLAYERIKTDSFTEKAHSANAGLNTALHHHGSSDTLTTGSLGLKGVWLLSGQSSLYADLGWQHNFGCVTPDVNLNFAGGSRYNIRGIEVNRNAAQIGLGASLQLRSNMSLSVGYEGLFGNQSRDHAGKVLWTLQF